MKKYVFVPRGGMTKADFGEQITKLWKLNDPSLLVQLTPTFVKPDQMLSKTTVISPHSSTFSKFAKPFKQEDEENLIKTANKVYSDRLQRCIGSVATAVETSRSWFLTVGPPGTPHRILDLAIKETKASPIILVVDNPATADIKTMFLGKKKAGTTDTMRAFACPYMCHSTKATTEEWPYSEVVEAAKETLDLLWSNSNPITESPTPVVIDPFDLHENDELLSDNNTYHEEEDGVYPMWCHSGGTHFIFTDEFDEFDPSFFAPHGYLCVGGLRATKAVIQNAASSNTPAILIRHATGTTQQYALAIQEILKRESKP